MPPNVNTLYSTRYATEQLLADADVIIGAVLLAGAAAPKIITREMLKLMKPRAVIVDVAIDQGGCTETSRATYHNEPTYNVDGIVHYCVANMPGAVPRTSTYGLTNATLPYVIALADKGWRAALADDPALREGLNLYDGKITCSGVADSFGMECVDPETIIG
jgi:alanine dehydrogenase